jgi:hypothetical protein
MNRREAMASLVTTIAIPEIAQETFQINHSGTIANSVFPSPPIPSKEDRDKEYAVCKLRGHTPTVWGNLHTVYTNTVFVAIQDAPQDQYQAERSTGWETCWFCKKQYRYVTKIEEKDAQ